MRPRPRAARPDSNALTQPTRVRCAPGGSALGDPEPQIHDAADAHQGQQVGAEFRHMQVPVNAKQVDHAKDGRSAAHTSERQSLMRISSAVFGEKKKTTPNDSTQWRTQNQT